MKKEVGMVFELFLCLSHLFYFVCLLEFVVHVLAWTLKKKGIGGK